MGKLTTALKNSLRVCALMISCLTLLVSIAQVVYADTVITAVYPSFNSTNILAFRLNGNAIQAGNAIILTPATIWQYGSAWWQNRVTLQNQRSFSAFFSFKVTFPSSPPADGIVFAIQTESNAAGGAGGGIGYGGINHSIGIEYDTYNNNGDAGFNDTNANHVAIDLNGSMISVASANASSIGTLSDGNTYYSWIDYDGATGIIEVRLNTSNNRPAGALLSHTFSPGLESYFGQDVYVGFTAGTGGAYEQHEIDSFYFNNNYIPGSITPGIETYTAGPTTVELSASPVSIQADGTTNSTISATAKDVNGTPMSGQTIDFTTNLGTLSAASSVTNSSGIATVNLTGTSAGTAKVRGTATGGAYGETNVILQYVTTTSVSSSVNPSVRGQGVTFTATVTATAPGAGTPTGTVQFQIDGIDFGSPVAVVSGNASSGATSSLTVASHNIAAIYSGDTDFLTSTSITLSQVVNQAGTTTSLSSSANPSVWGQGVTFVATVSVISPGAGTPTGTVTFNDGADILGTSTISGGQAAYSTVSLLPNNHNISAIYNGDGHFLTSIGATTQIVINPMPIRPTTVVPTPTPKPTSTPANTSTPIDTSTSTYTPTEPPKETLFATTDIQSDVLIVELLGVESSVGFNRQTGTGASMLASTRESNISISVPQGTIAYSPNGSLTQKITIKNLNSLLEQPANATILKAFDCGPDGTIFSNSIILTLSYKPNDLPPDVIEDNLFIATWNESSWNPIPCVVDKVAYTVTAHIGHFSSYALMIPIPNITPPPAGPTFNIWLTVIIIVIVIIIITIILFFILGKRRKKKEYSSQSSKVE